MILRSNQFQSTFRKHLQRSSSWYVTSYMSKSWEFGCKKGRDGDLDIQADDSPPDLILLCWEYRGHKMGWHILSLPLYYLANNAMSFSNILPPLIAGTDPFSRPSITICLLCSHTKILDCLHKNNSFVLCIVMSRSTEEFLTSFDGLLCKRDKTMNYLTKLVPQWTDTIIVDLSSLLSTSNLTREAEGHKISHNSQVHSMSHKFPAG